MHSNLSRMAVVMWLFVAMVISQSYTASLASMLTAKRLEPTITNVETLKNTHATVGYCSASVVGDFLKNVLSFDNVVIKSYNSIPEYAEALDIGEISAIFLEVPVAKIFLSQYCGKYTRTRETFKLGGFGFVSLQPHNPDTLLAILGSSIIFLEIC